MGKVLSFGELLLRICPDTEGVWMAENKLPFYVGGAELNVATALALWQIPSSYFTALPKNFMAEQIVQYLHRAGVEASKIHYSGDRIGLYYLPKGKDLKNAGVIYDRAHSSFASLLPVDFNWDQLFEDVEWFHFSAICPALNQNAADVCLAAVQEAKRRNITVSIDLNYRAKLWQYGKQPHEIVPQLASYCDLIMGNIWAAERMLGIKLPDAIHHTTEKSALLAQATSTSEQIATLYPQCKWVANTFRFDHGDKGIRYFTTLYSDGKLHDSHEYVVSEILDKVGSGDCFMAGLIYGFYQGRDPLQTLNFATAAAFNKLFIPSDCTTASVEDVLQTLHQHEQN